MVSYRDCGEKKLKFDNWSQTFTEITFKGECIAAQGVCGCLCVCGGGCQCRITNGRCSDLTHLESAQTNAAAHPCTPLPASSPARNHNGRQRMR